MNNNSSIVYVSSVHYTCVRLVLGTAEADVSLQQYSCCLLYQCLLTDPRHYVQGLVHGVDGGPPLMSMVLSYLVDGDCEWGSVFFSLSSSASVHFSSITR